MTQLRHCTIARGPAEMELRAACSTLLATSPAVVNALTLSVPVGEYDATVAEWNELAQSLADQSGLRAEVSMPRDHLRIRFSRGNADERQQ